MDRGAEQSTVHGFQRVGHDCCGKINIHNINFTILILLKFRYNSVTLGALTISVTIMLSRFGGVKLFMTP